MVINSPWIMPFLGTKGLASPVQTATAVAGSRFPEDSSLLLIFDVQVQQGYADVLELNLLLLKSSASACNLTATSKPSLSYSCCLFVFVIVDSDSSIFALPLSFALAAPPFDVLQ
ncbi:hypothetical protein Tco_0963070 [Tanacetum coccineum]